MVFSIVGNSWRKKKKIHMNEHISSNTHACKQYIQTIFLYVGITVVKIASLSKKVYAAYISSNTSCLYYYIQTKFLLIAESVCGYYCS